MKRRKTQSKTEIFEALKASGRAMSHDMIQAAVSSDINRTTIYRVLNRYCEDGKVHRVVCDDGKQYFAICENCGEEKKIHSHNHIHFRCLSCDKVECLEKDLSLPLPDGYEPIVHNLVVSGLCNNCSVAK